MSVKVNQLIHNATIKAEAWCRPFASLQTLRPCLTDQSEANVALDIALGKYTVGTRFQVAIGNYRLSATTFIFFLVDGGIKRKISKTKFDSLPLTHFPGVDHSSVSISQVIESAPSSW